MTIKEQIIKEFQELKEREEKRFLPYLNKQGLNDTEIDKSKCLILLLQRGFGDSWRPGNCRAISSHTIEANKMLRANPYLEETFSELKDQRYLHSHFFWITRIRDKTFVLDPTGVPKDLRQYSDITPYFGLVENSSGSHRKIYDKMQDLDSWGTRGLPPNFYP